MRFAENRCPCETKELSIGEELFDRAMIFTELGAMALIENEDDAFVAERREALLVVLLVRSIQSQAQLLDRRNDHFVCDVV